MTNNNKDQQRVAAEEQELNGQHTEALETDEPGAEPAVDEQKELETVRAERDRYLDQLQRSVAEFTNYRRRSEQERAQLVPIVRRDVLLQFLPVMDDLERAMAQIPEDKWSDGWVTGLVMIESKFRNLLERADVTPIDPVGEPFDPSRHEAVATEPGTDGSTVVEVYQKGYAIGDVLIRPAMVKTGAPQDEDGETPRAEA
ncbi:MAG TPA: nucleotide exchange factor GrpE [Thermomicrobiales bacterium]|nr:nucleotide exchange factor GrpE [Thermomicrobiales bacterium]